MVVSPSIRYLYRYFVRHRVFRALVIIFVIWNAVEVLQIHLRLSRSNSTDERLPRGTDRIYIASLHWNNEAILRSHWNNAVIELANALGPENIFISIYESGSWDNSKGALIELDEELGRLGVPRNITLSETTHLDEISSRPTSRGWIETPRGRKELRRIPYLARLRNLTLRPLEDLLKQGKTFDKILFLNDVAFTVWTISLFLPRFFLICVKGHTNDCLKTSDVIKLLNTNNGVYAAACSLDFSKPPLYYDTFALRDSEGHEHVMQTWPFFRSANSREAMKTLSPVPVASCWNGMGT